MNLFTMWLKKWSISRDSCYFRNYWVWWELCWKYMRPKRWRLIRSIWILMLSKYSDRICIWNFKIGFWVLMLKNRYLWLNRQPSTSKLKLTGFPMKEWYEQSTTPSCLSTKSKKLKFRPESILEITSSWSISPRKHFLSFCRGCSNVCLPRSSKWRF